MQAGGHRFDPGHVHQFSGTKLAQFLLEECDQRERLKPKFLEALLGVALVFAW